MYCAFKQWEVRYNINFIPIFHHTFQDPIVQNFSQVLIILLIPFQWLSVVDVCVQIFLWKCWFFGQGPLKIKKIPVKIYGENWFLNDFKDKGLCQYDKQIWYMPIFHSHWMFESRDVIFFYPDSPILKAAHKRVWQRFYTRCHFWALEPWVWRVRKEERKECVIWFILAWDAGF